MPQRARLFTVIALLAVGAVNAAGLLSIAASRRDARGEAARLFRLDTQARARALEARLAAIRSELGFLSESPPITRLVGPVGSEALAERDFRRQAAEAALLLFLRAHSEVTRLSVRGWRSEPLLLAGRRGGVPVLWIARSPTGSEGPAVSPDHRWLEAVAPLGDAPANASQEAGPSLSAEVSPGLMVGEAVSAEAAASPECRLADATGKPRARSQPAAAGRQLEASAAVVTDGWRPPSRWSLRCEQSEEAATALVEPVAARYRTTLVLNLAAMGLALLLGLLAVREVSQRERLEARAREEARVRDLERQLFHAERLTSAGRLAAGIAHEISNPLEGMANYLSLAKDALERGEIEQARRRLEGLRQGLERAALVVRQVLAHADPATAPLGPVDLNRVLAETTDFVRSRPEFAKIRFETELEAAALVVEGSSIMLSQVALNLVVNACEAQPAGGEVRVSSRRAAQRVHADVADRGPGISAADRERIFEPFFSTKNSTGLGLSICHSIVRQHGGELLAIPRDGGGTVFRMTLPAGAARPEAA